MLPINANVAKLSFYSILEENIYFHIVDNFKDIPF